MKTKANPTGQQRQIRKAKRVVDRRLRAAQREVKQLTLLGASLILLTTRKQRFMITMLARKHKPISIVL